LARDLVADFGQTAVLHPVAGRADGYDLDRSRCGEIGVGRGQAVADDSDLAQRHRAAAGIDAQGARRHGYSPRSRF